MVEFTTILYHRINGESWLDTAFLAGTRSLTVVDALCQILVIDHPRHSRTQPFHTSAQLCIPAPALADMQWTISSCRMSRREA